MKKDFFSSQFNLTTVFFGTTAFFMTVAGMMALDLVDLPSESESEEKGSFPLISEMSKVEAGGYGTNVKCFDGFRSWESSTSFRSNASWSTAFMADDPVSPTNGAANSGYK